MQQITHDDFLCNRHIRLPKKQHQSVEFTHDAALIHQYHLLSNLNIAGTSAKLGASIATEHDDRSHIMVVRIGDKVIGGGRLIIRKSADDEKLPIEHTEFSIAQALPEFRLDTKGYAEISKLFLLEQYRSESLLEEMFFHLTHQLKKLNLRYGFSIETPPMPKASSHPRRGYRLEHYQINQPLRQLSPVELPSYRQLIILEAMAKQKEAVQNATKHQSEKHYNPAT